MEKLCLNIDVLLPNLTDAEDPCVSRIKTKLEELTGIHEVHVTGGSESQLCLHYDPSVVTLASLKRFTEDAGAVISERYHHEILPISGMDCSDCVLSIEHTLNRMDGVLSATVNYAAAVLRVEYDATITSKGKIVTQIRRIGYRIPKDGVAAFIEQKRELIFVLASGVFLALGFVLSSRNSTASLICYIAAYIAGGYDIARHAWSAVMEKHFDTDLLMVAAAIGAACLGDYFEGALLLFLFSLGHVLEEMALDKARNAVRALGQLTPKTAIVRRNDKEEELSIDNLVIDDVVLIKPGARIPADGTLITGSSAIDQSPITGESVPVEKSSGDKVFAGTVNGEGAIEIKVTRLSKDNTLAKVMQLVEEAQSQKTISEKMTESFTRKFVPAVLIGDVIFVVIQVLFSIPLHTAFLRAMTVLVAASPCALALGTPSAMLSAIARAASKGILVKGGVHLETLGKVDSIAFDKTGTLTHGKPEIEDIVVFDDQISEDVVIGLAASAESKSGHPLAMAFKRAAEARSVKLSPVEEVTSVTGKGLRAVVEGRSVLLGNSKLMLDENVKVTESISSKVSEASAKGKTPVLMGLDGSLSAIFLLADAPRDNAKESILQLKKLGIKQTILLTGDNESVGRSMAERLGLDAVRADLMPQDKVDALKELTSNRVTAMVGDGVNDAPALAAANVGIAMGGASTDVALETADIALMNDDLSKLPYAVSLGRATLQVVKQNIFISSGVIILLLLTSVLGITSIALAVIIHEGSTLLVVANSLRLLRH